MYLNLSQYRPWRNANLTGLERSKLPPVSWPRRDLLNKPIPLYKSSTPNNSLPPSFSNTTSNMLRFFTATFSIFEAATLSIVTLPG